MNFSDILKYLNLGQAAQREGWNGKGMFVFKQITAEIEAERIADMQSLPQPVKSILLRRKQSLSYSDQMNIVNAENRIDSWVPSVSDIFALDWQLVDY